MIVEKVGEVKKVCLTEPMTFSPLKRAVVRKYFTGF